MKDAAARVAESGVVAGRGDFTRGGRRGAGGWKNARAAAAREVESAVVREGQGVIGEVMRLSLSFDHRIVDGHVGAAFAYEIIKYLHDPDALFLEG